MESILKFMGGALGLLVPALLIYVINYGILNSDLPLQKKRNYKMLSIVFIACWTGVVWLLSIMGAFSYHDGDIFPRFLLPLFLPVVLGIVLLFTTDFSKIINNIPVATLAGVQSFRLAGFAFIIIANLHILPSAFSTGGYGDLFTGTLAITAALMLSKRHGGSRFAFWACNVVGLLDLLNVAFLLLFYYPIWNHSPITSAAAFDFSLIMIPAIAAPAALLLHLYAIINYLSVQPQYA